jgi:hypothetical protein
LSGKDLKEGGFSGAVGTDQTVAASLGKFDIYILEKSLFS